MRCVVTGATGYIGGRLAPRLAAEGHDVRCVVRNPEKMRDVPWAQAERVEVVAGDVLDEAAMRRACADADVLYYLVHSLSEQGFAAIDRRAALISAQAAREAGVRRVVYLGGIHPEGVDYSQLSEHLASRTEVGEIFLRSGVPTVVLQAAVILGSGSASFEMLRYLTDRLPVMLTPSWVHHRVQPIAIRDVLHYLTRVVHVPPETNRTFDIAGPDVLTYLQMMEGFAAEAGLPRRTMLPVPVLTPRLSSHWVNLVTPVPRSTAVPLIDSLVHDVVATEHDIDTFVSQPAEGLTSFREAVGLALTRVREGQVETRWSGTGNGDAPSDPLPTDPDWAGGTVYTDVRERRTTADPERLWTVITEQDRSTFPLSRTDTPWQVEECIGPRSDPDERAAAQQRLGTRPGEHLLRLRGPMTAPGQAWLELRVVPDGDGSVCRQRAVFLPRGLTGHAYWWSLAPVRTRMLGAMAGRIVAAAEGR